MNMNGYPRNVTRIVRGAWFGCALFAVMPSTYAQMQIPNPLIRPRSLTNPAAPTPTPPAPTAETAAARVPPPYPSGVPLGTPPLPTDDPYLRELTELKERFAGFYVSAVVGRTAVLRRSVAQRLAANPTTPSQVGTSMAPLPLASAGSGAALRNDALMVADGELLDAVSNSGTLMSKVAHHRVVIYHMQETVTMPGGRLGGRRAIVFSGEVEGSGAASMPAIVLERSDSAFKRSISVETKTRNASGATSDNQNAAGANQSPAALAQ